jgi:hypothetical protein
MVTLITTQTTAQGAGPTLAVYRDSRQPGAYLVGTIDPQTQRLTPLKNACFWTYDAAQARLAHEAHAGFQRPAKGANP